MLLQFQQELKVWTEWAKASGVKIEEEEQPAEASAPSDSEEDADDDDLATLMKKPQAKNSGNEGSLEIVDDDEDDEEQEEEPKPKVRSSLDPCVHDPHDSDVKLRVDVCHRQFTACQEEAGGRVNEGED